MLLDRTQSVALLNSPNYIERYLNECTTYTDEYLDRKVRPQLLAYRIGCVTEELDYEYWWACGYLDKFLHKYPLDYKHIYEVNEFFKDAYDLGYISCIRDLA